MRRGYKLGRKCPCGSDISDRAMRCHPCALKQIAADPERGKKISHSLKERLKDPANYARHLEKARIGGITKSRNLEWCAQSARLMREKIQPMSQTPEALARRDYSITGQRSADSKLSWCPDEMRQRYRHLTKSKRMRKADAMEIVLSEWADIQAARSGNIDDAMHWLNRIAPTRKLADGSYQYGSATMGAGDLIKRAELKGWKPVDNGDFRSITMRNSQEHAIEQTVKTQEERLAA